MKHTNSEKHWNKTSRVAAGVLAVIMLLAGCGVKDVKGNTVSQSTAPALENAEERRQTATEQETVKEEETAPVKESAAQEEKSEMRMKIGDTETAVEWEKNESVEALKELCRNAPLTIQMSMYGGFEQVGSLGTSLPRNDIQTTTSAGDIVLYSGNQMVIFYGSNSWAYTRLGRITDKSAREMADLLGNENVTVTIGEFK